MDVTSPEAGSSLTLLIDSNVFIAAEDHGSVQHVHGHQAAELLGLANRLGYRVVVSDGTRSDVLQAPPAVRTKRLRSLEKYDVLAPVPTDARVRAEFPADLSGSNVADLEVLSAFAAGTAHWLVTLDERMRARARRAGLEHVLAPRAALELLRPLVTVRITSPSVRRVPGYVVGTGGALFDSLRQDYDFDTWWRTKVCIERRDTIVLGAQDDPEGIAVLKVESDNPHRLGSPILKVCTFKVSDEFQGTKRGELLLKATVDYARQRRVARLYMEVLSDKADLLAWLQGFGFLPVKGATTPRSECVLLKNLIPPGADHLPPLDHAVAYGPGSVRVERAHVVPIRDAWHQRLLPEADLQSSLFDGEDACGNAIGKAYLCHAATRKITPGDLLLFARTGAGPAAVTTVGCVEQTLVSRRPEEIISVVGQRTVYTAVEIGALCAQGNVLAIRFRLDRTLNKPWPVKTLQAEGLLNGHPQSIAEVTAPRGLNWVRTQLDAWL